MGGRPWYAWEWLYDGAIAAVHHFTGLNGVVLVTALLISITFAWVFRLSLNRGSSMLVTLILLVLSVFASSIHFFARPHVLSWLMAVVWFDIIDRSETSAEKRRQLWLLVPLTPLWVNVHGGFLLGFALLAIYLAAAAIRYFRSKDIEERSKTRTWLNQLSKVTLLSALATLANPYGYHLHVHVYRYLSDRFLMNHIDEFHSPNFHGLAQQCFAAMLLITLVAMAIARGRLRTTHLLVVVFSAYSGLYASRNLPTSCILLMLVIGPILSKAISDLRNDTSVAHPLRRLAERLYTFDARMHNMEFRFRGHLWPAVMVILGLAVCIHGGRIGSRQFMRAHFDAKRFPVQAADVIAQRDIHEPIFAPDYWGGYLIYRFYPQVKVAVDDRHDLYGDQFLKDYLRVINIQSGWDDVLTRQQVNWVLMPAGSSLANLLKETRQWTIRYEDGVAVLFQKTR